MSDVEREQQAYLLLIDGLRGGCRGPASRSACGPR